jgi:hypothetical protein
MHSLRILSCILLIISTGGSARDSSVTTGAEVCTDEDYAIFSAAFYALPGFQRPDSMIVLDRTANGYPPGLGAVTRANSGKEVFYRDVPKEAQDELNSRNKSRSHIDVSKIQAPFKALSLSDEEAEKLLNRKNGWAEFHEKYPTTRALVAISLPGINRERDRALLYIGSSCGPVCGGGVLVLLSKTDGKWKVVNTLDVWVS